jgi:uncharacterized iron-regulated protein
MKNSFLYLLLIFSLPLFAQEKTAFRIFNAQGSEVSYENMLGQLAKNDLIFFGELHDDPIAHWLELEISRDLYKISDSLTIGLEMFEADNQLILNEYLSGLIAESHLLNEAKVWDNYKTDYRPLVEFARENKLPVIATNIPRRYANLVYRKGLAALDSLPEEARKWIAPLPVTIDMSLKGYEDMLKAMNGHGNSGTGEKLVQAQAIKDATMAHFILKNLTSAKLIHINGAYHSRYGEGIIWYLRQAQPDLKIASIETLRQADNHQLMDEHKQKADYLICIPESMTRTFISR